MPRKLIVSPLLLLLLAGCSRSRSIQTAANVSGTVITSESVVRAVASPLELSPGTSADAIVQITVQNGYHINANPPTYPYLKATELELRPNGGISVAFITFPNSIEKKFPFAEKPVAVYEGDNQLKVALKAAPSAPKGASNLAGKLKIQACDNQVCYPPGEIDVAIPVTVK